MLIIIGSCSLVALYTNWDVQLTFMWPRIVTNFIIIKPTRRTNFTNLLCNKTLHVSDTSSVHHQEFIHCTLRKGIYHIHLLTAFEQDQWTCSKAVCTVPVWHIPLLSVQWINSWWRTEELSETCGVSCQNKFVKLVHLVGFITKKFGTNHVGVFCMLVRSIDFVILPIKYLLLLLHTNFNNFNSFITLVSKSLRLPEDDAEVSNHVGVLTKYYIYIYIYIINFWGGTGSAQKI
jgi:hypothetical protein